MGRDSRASIQHGFGCGWRVHNGTASFLSRRAFRFSTSPSPGGGGVRVAAEASRDARIVYYSPDGNEDPLDIERLDDLLIEGNDLAIASRFAVGSINEETDWMRPGRVNQTLTWMANKLFNQGPFVTDTINGFLGHAPAFLDMDTSVKRSHRVPDPDSRHAPPMEDRRASHCGRPMLRGESKAISWPVGKDHPKVLITELPGSRLFQ